MKLNTSGDNGECDDAGNASGDNSGDNNTGGINVLAAILVETLVPTLGTQVLVAMHRFKTVELVVKMLVFDKRQQLCIRSISLF